MVIISALEKIPKNKPIIFSPNHQNALSDPMAILVNTKFQPVWLARADIFKNKTGAAILKFLKIMPVYRMRDGKENLAKNDETFTDRDQIVNFGNPIPGIEYLEAFQQSESAAILLLRQRILDEMQPLVLEIKSHRYYDDFETIREIYGKYYIKRQKQKYSTLNHFKSDRELVQKLDALEEKFPEVTEKLVQQVNEYVSKIKDKGFWSTFFLALGIILFPIFYLIEFFVVSWLIPGIKLFGYFLFFVFFCLSFVL